MFAPIDVVPHKRRQAPFLARIAVPALAAVLAMAVVLTAVILMAASQANDVATDRQEKLIRTVLEQRIAGIAHDQEGVTIWDDAVREVRRPKLDLQWMDDNLGIWLHSYFAHDEAYVLDDRDRPIYAMRDGRRAQPAVYDRELRSAAAPLIAKLRAAMRDPSVTIAPSMRSPGAFDIAMVAGHPAIVSVKPIMSDTGKPREAGESGYLHISVRRLDGTFPAALARDYALDGARFAA